MKNINQIPEPGDQPPELCVYCNGYQNPYCSAYAPRPNGECYWAKIMDKEIRKIREMHGLDKLE